KEVAATSCVAGEPGYGQAWRSPNSPDFWIHDAVQRCHIGHHRGQIGARKGGAERRHRRTLHTPLYSVADKRLIKAARSQAGRAAIGAASSMAVPGGAGFTEDVFALLQNVRQALRAGE